MMYLLRTVSCHVGKNIVYNGHIIEWQKVGFISMVYNRMKFNSEWLIIVWVHSLTLMMMWWTHSVIVFYFITSKFYSSQLDNKYDRSYKYFIQSMIIFLTFFKFSIALIQTEVKLLSNKNKILLCIAGIYIRHASYRNVFD